MQPNIIQDSKNNEVSNHSDDAPIVETNERHSLSLTTQQLSDSNSTSEKIENPTTESGSQSAAQELINQGNKLWQEEKLDEAISTFQQATKSDANDYKAHHFIGCIFAKQSKLEAAVAAYNKALEINPNYHWSHHSLGQVLLWQGKVDQAISATYKAIEIEPEEAEFYYLLGKCLERQGNAEEAVAAYQEAIKIKSDFALVREALGNLVKNENEVLKSLANTKASATGEKLVSSATEIDTQSATQELINQGNKLWQEGKLDEAISTFQQATELDANNYKADHFIGCIFAKQSKLEAAVAAYNKALKINPNYHWSYHGLGQVLLWQGKVDQAIAATHKAIEIEPDEAEFHYLLGKCLERQGNAEEALAAYGEAIELNEHQPEFYVDLVNLLIHLQQWSTVKKYISLAVSKFPNPPQILADKVRLLRNIGYLPDVENIHEEWLYSADHNKKVDPQSASAEFELGKQLFEQEKWSEAIDAYSSAIELDPENAWYYCGLGVALSKQGKYSKAERAHLQAIKLNSNSAWIYICLGEALLNQGKWQEATDAFYQAINLETEIFRHYSELGEALLKQEKWQEATDVYHKAIIVDPDNSLLYARLGNALSKQERWSEVESAYRSGIELQPDCADLYDGLITALLQQNKIDEVNLAKEHQQLQKAVVYHRQQLRNNSRNCESQRSLAQALSKLGHWSAAAVAYRYALELDPHQTELYKSLGEALDKQKKWDEAEVVYRQAVEFAPEDFWLHNSLGQALAKQGKWAEATTVFRQAIDLNSEDIWIYDSIGQVLAKQGKWDEVAVVYRQAIKLCPDNLWLQTCLAKALAKQGQWTEASTTYRHSLELDPLNFGYYENLGDALFSQGQWEKAVVAYRQDFEQYPDLSWSHKLSFVGWSYHEQGESLIQASKWQEAEQAYQKAIELNPDLPWHYSGLGKALEKQQKWQEASAAYGKAAALTKGSLYFQQNPDKALQHMTGKGLVICIYTCAKNKDEQQAIRDTWLKEVIKHNIPYFFVIGQPSSRSYVEGDILYVDAPDTYEHLPRKTYKIFEYIYNYTFYSHVLKIDDDCYVNVDNLLQCGFEKYDYMGKVAGYVDDLDRNWHEGKTFDPNIGEYTGEHKGTWANGASGYFLNRYAMRKLLEYPNHKEIAFELYEDKLIGDILREFKIEPICSPKYLVGVERDDQHMDYNLGLVPWHETPYPHQSNEVVVFHSDNAPDVHYEIHQHFYDSNFKNRTFLKSPYWWQGWPHDNICLERVDDKKINLTFKDVLCFLVVRNELLRLPYLFEYYRSKGIRNFFVVDNHSNDGTMNYLLEQPDVYIWHTTRPYGESRWGVDWVELLLQNYGVNRWCLLVDADEILYYPDCETKDIPQLCEELDRENKQALSTILLDMYSKEPIKNANYTPGQNFLEVCSYFDKEFYSLKASKSGPYKNLTGYWGGLRQRIFENMTNESGQKLFCLNKVPLIKYDYSVKLCEGFHWVDNVDFASQTGCLLHFKYFSTFHERAKQEVERGQHWNNASEYGQYLQKLEQNPQLSFYNAECSVEFKDSQQLSKLGIISQDE